MSPRRALVLLAAAALPLGIGLTAHAPPAETPAVQWAGPHSAIDVPQFHRVSDRETFAALWAEHRGERLERNLRDWPVTPQIDFERHEVVAYFRGPSHVDDGEFVREVVRRGETMVIRFDALTFQTATFGDAPAPDYSCTPYGVWVIDRHEGPIVIEEDQRQLIAAPPMWVEVHRFDPH